MAGAWQFASQPDYAPWIRTLVGAKNRPPRLSQPALNLLKLIPDANTAAAVKRFKSARPQLGSSNMVGPRTYAAITRRGTSGGTSGSSAYSQGFMTTLPKLRRPSR